jgi:hypothetical protein
MSLPATKSRAEPGRAPRRPPDHVLLALIIAFAAAVRVPVWANADRAFNSDEAINGLVLKHLVEHGDVTLYAWGQSYYGIVESLLALPFVAVDGWTPLALKLGAFVGFAGLLVAVFALGRRLFGPTEGLLAAGLLALFSPFMVAWSCLASGGYTLMLAWGVATIAFALRLGSLPDAERTRGRLFTLGLLIGAGLYIYELYAVFVVVLGGVAAWRLRHHARALLYLVPGVVLGWTPKLVAVATGHVGVKRPSYGLASPERMLDNLSLLAKSGPALFGANPQRLEVVEPFTGSRSVPMLLLGMFVLGLCAVAWAWGLRLRREPRFGATAEGFVLRVLLALPPVAIVLYVVSPNPEDLPSNRYLLPAIPGLVLLVAAMLVRLRGRAPRVATVLGVLALAAPAALIVSVYQGWDYLGPKGGVRTAPDAMPALLASLRDDGVRAAYGPYWVGYRATFMSGEDVLVAPWEDVDRHPADTTAAARERRVAYIFEAGTPAERSFGARARATGRPFTRRPFGELYVVYAGRDYARLL